jgi:hypothetical protein
VVKIIVAACLIVVAAFIILPGIIQKKIRQQFTRLPPAMQIKFSAIHTNILSSSISFDSLDLGFTPYPGRQQNQHRVRFSKVSVNGVRFFKILFNKQFVAEKLRFEDGNIQLDQFLIDKKDSLQSKILKEIEWPFKKLFIGKVELKRVTAFLHSDQNDQLLAKGDAVLGGVSMDNPGKKPVLNTIDLHLSDLKYSLQGYEVQMRQLEINSNKKTLAIDSFRVISGKTRTQAQISAIKITGFDVRKLLNDQVLITDKMIFNKSRIVIGNNEELKLRPLPFNPKKMRADVFQFNDASVLYRDKLSSCSFAATIALHKLDFSQSSGKDDFHFGSLRASFTGVQYSGGTYHNTEIKKIEVDSKKEIIRMDGLRIIPRFGKYEFARKLGHQADRVEANVSKIEIIKPDIEKLLRRKLFAEKIMIGESRAYIFRDRRLPRPQKNLPLPATFIKTLPIDIRVKTFSLASSTVSYEEYPRSGYGQTGILIIEKAGVIMSPFINHPVASDPACITMNATGSIMGSGTVHGTILMPLQRNGAYRIKGAIEKLELTKLNSSSENLGKIRIKSGFLDFLFFDFTMTEERSTGKIIGVYHHLIIQQLKKHKDEKNVADFASFMLRNLIIPLNKDKSLPERKRTGLVNYTRDPTRFVSHYFLQSLLMGVKKSFALGFLLPK